MAATSLCPLLIAAGIALVSAASVNVQVAEPIDHVIAAPSLPKSWTVVEETMEAKVNVIIRLRENNVEELKKITLDVSNPKSPKYGQHLTSKQVQDLVQPSPESFNTVKTWLNSHNIVYKVQGSNIFLEDASVSDLAALFNTKFSSIVNTETGVQHVIAGDVTVPADVNKHVDAFYGIHGLPLPPRKSQIMQPGEPAKVTPTVINTKYGVSGVKVSRGTKNRQAVGEFQGQSAEPKDLSKFFEKFVPNAEAGDDTIYKIVGTDGKAPGVEASLDIEYIMGVAPGIKTEFWGFQKQDFCADLLSFTSQIISSDDAPNVFSISYGWQGEISQVCPTGNIGPIDTDFAKIGAMGISVMISSGDSGSAYTPGESCGTGEKGVAYEGTSHVIKAGFGQQGCCLKAAKAQCKGFTEVGGNFEKKCLCFTDITGTKQDPKSSSGKPSDAKFKLYASWPASSPYVTAVGATRFIGQNTENDEMAVDQFGSGGGFYDSSVFSQQNAQYEVSDVKKYLANTSIKFPPAGSFDPEGRATPDVSALGEGFQVINGGGTLSVGGTSASSPTFAGLVSLLNEARLAAGKPKMGFLNPFLYQNEDAFFDVTVGSDKIGRSGQAVPYGFECATGWDPVTGLGTPLFQKLLEASQQAASQQ
eukprot:m.332968 g.332968  ORF g.332968 m.332968 type:complete len:644 (-) comp17037_c0_seq1:896-2827(-)